MYVARYRCQSLDMLLQTNMLPEMGATRLGTDNDKIDERIKVILELKQKTEVRKLTGLT